MTRRASRRRRHLRVRRKIFGTPHRPRLSVYRSNRYIYAQLVDDVGGRTLVAASSLEEELRDRSLDVETAEEVGKLLGQRAKEAGIEEVVFDRGGFKYHGRIRALAEGVRQEGLRF